MISDSIRIVNVIASTRIKGSFDLETLSQKLSNAQYEPEMFSGLILKKNKLTPTIIMFASGKISSHGAKSEEESKQAILTEIREVAELGCIIGDAKTEDIRIENVVGTGYLGHSLNLETIADCLSNAVYKPKRFPGLLLRPFKNSIVCIVFSNGKISIVGGKSEEAIRFASEHIARMIEQGTKTASTPA